MLKDVNVGMSHLLVRGAIILVVGIVFHVQPQAWKYTMKSIDQLVVDDLNHISNEKTTLVK